MQAAHSSSQNPLPWVRRYVRLIPAGSRVLDLACGSGRHARCLLEQGYRVVAADIDLTGVNDLAHDDRVELVQADLERAQWPFEKKQFGGIIVTNYLHRPLFSNLIDSLDDEGVLIYDTFARGNERFGRPSNPDYLLREGELLDAFGIALNVMAYACGEVGEPAPAVRQSLCAVRERRSGRAIATGGPS